MLGRSMSEQEVIDHFLSHGKTANEIKRETPEKIQALWSNVTCLGDKFEADNKSRELRRRRILQNTIKIWRDG